MKVQQFNSTQEILSLYGMPRLDTKKQAFTQATDEKTWILCNMKKGVITTRGPHETLAFWFGSNADPSSH